MRTAFWRLTVSLIVLWVCLLGFGTITAFASHFRYGTISWVRLPDPDATHYAVQLTFQTGYRWSYPYGQFSGVEPNYCLSAPSSFIPTQPADSNPQGSGACPPVGSVEQLGGGNDAGFITFNTGVQITGGGATTGTTLVTSTPHIATITQVVPQLDTMYATWTATVTFLKTSNPVTATFTDTARLVALLDNNADTPWNIQAVIDVNTQAQSGSDGTVVSHSPQSASLPLIFVNTGVANEVVLPIITFDNMTAQLSIAPQGNLSDCDSSILTNGSCLNTPEPPGMTLSTTTPGLLTFTPPTDGLYSVQFDITSYDTNGKARNTVPLELIFSSSTCTGTCPNVTLSSGSTVYTTGVGQPLTATVAATGTNLQGSGWTTSIGTSPLPAGMTVQNITGYPTSTSTITWTPTLSSTSSIVCFQGIATNPVSTVDSTQALCINFYIGALQTTLVAYPASGAGGGPVTLSANLTRTLDGLPLVNELITFALVSDPGVPLATAYTNNAGTATATFISTFAAPNGIPYQATFNAVANQFLQASSSQSVVVVKVALTAMNPPVAVANPSPSVGFPSQVSAVLNRIFTDGGLYAPPGTPVTFTLTPPGNLAPPITVTGFVAGSVGLATATFTPTVAGAYSAVASFAGDDILFGADTSGDPATASSTIQVAQRLQLTSAPATGAAGVPLTVSTTLTQIPSATPVSGRTVTFTFPGGTPATQVATTNINGVASAMTTFATPGSPTITASYTPLTGELNDAGNPAAEVASISATINPTVATTLSNLSVSSTSPVGNPVTVSTTLATPGGTISNASVTFTVTGPSSFTLPATTYATGVATVSFTPSVRGQYQVSASFAGAPGLIGSSSNTAALTVYQKASLSMTPSTGTAGQPLTLTATLMASPQQAGISGEAVTFSFTGSGPGAPGPQTALTGANGVASVTVTFADSGTFSANTSFIDAPNFFTNHLGNIPPAPETAFATVIVSPATPIVGGPQTGATNYGAQTTLSETISPESGGPIPTGTVTFQFMNSSGTASFVCSGGSVQTQSCAIPLDATGNATVTTGNLPVGTDSITATYSGDAVYAGGEQSALTFTVSQDTTQVALTISPSSPAPTYGNAVNLSALVSDNTGGTMGTPTGTAQFAYSTDGVNWTNLGSAIALDTTGAAQLQTTSLPAGTPTVRVSYSGDQNFIPGSASASETVNPLGLTVAGLTAQNKTYDGGTNATISGSGTLVGVLAVDTGLVTLNTSSVAGTFPDKNVGSGKTVAVSGLTLSGPSAGNYSLTQPSMTASITPATLTVTATGNNKTYDGTTTAMVSLSDNRVLGDALIDTYSSASFADKNVGTGKIVSVSGILAGGTDALNYIANTTTSTTAAIGAHSLVVTATGNNKTYDGTTTATVALTDNRLSGDQFTDNYSSASFAQADAGSGIAVSVSGISITGTDAGNYTFNATAVTSANITAANAGFSLNPTNASYGQSVTLSVTVTPVNGGMVPGGTVTFSFTDSNNVVQNICGGGGALSTTACPIALDGNGNGSVTTTNLPEGAADSVIVAYQPNGVDYQSGTATITASISKANTLAGLTKAVDPTIYSQAVTLSGSVADNTSGSTKVPTGSVMLSFAVPNTTTVDYICSNGTISVSSCSINLDTTGSYSVQNITAMPAGLYNITASYSGDTDFVGTTANLAQTVKQFNLSVAGVTANDKTYDGGTSALLNTTGAALVGVVSGDNVMLVTTGATGTFSDKNVGTGKAVTVSGLTITGASATNYSLTQPAPTATISAATLTVGAAGNNKVYDRMTTATVGLTDNRVSGDALTDAYASASFSDKNVGTGKTVNVAGISISGTDAGNYTFNATATTLANITPLSLAVAATGVNKVYDGTTAASVNLTDNRISGDVFTDSDTSATFASASAGNGDAITVNGISINGADAGNYTANTTASTSANITQAASVISWSNPAGITYGATLSGTQLNASAAGNGSSLAGTFTYNPAAGTILNAGNSQTLSVTFAPTDATDFSGSTATVQINVVKAASTITWPAPAAIAYPAALSGSQLDATASVAGTFIYTPAAGAVLTAGAHTLSVTFTPSNTQDYNAATTTVQLTVQKGTPTIAWPTPAAITYPAPLSATQLNATASVPGTFVYSRTSGTVLTAGLQTLSVTFTPTDPADYNGASATVQLTVQKGTPIITWPAPANITNPTALSSTQLDATASVPGTFVYTPAKGTVLSPGTQTLSTAFTPTDSADYNAATASVSITVNANGNLTIAAGQTVTFTNGTLSGNVTLNANSKLTLNNSQATGNVTVDNGATLVLNNSTVDQNVQVQAGGIVSLQSGSVIDGNLQMQSGGSLTTSGGTIDQNLQISGAATFSLNGTTVDQNVQILNVSASSSQNQICGIHTDQSLQIQNNAVAIEVGSSSPSCAGNTVAQNLQVQNNTAPITVYDNTVSGGNLQVQNNSTTVSVFDNHVSNNLQCSGNTTITSGGNTAGALQGQCVAPN